MPPDDETPPRTTDPTPSRPSRSLPDPEADSALLERSSRPIEGAEVDATNPENREVILRSIEELEARAIRRLEEEAELPPLPPPPQRRWSVAIPLLILAVVVWVAPLLTHNVQRLATLIPPTADPSRVEKAFISSAQRIDDYRLTLGELPNTLTEAGVFPAALRYFPDTGGSFLLELPTTRGLARLTWHRGIATFQLFGATDLRPAPAPIRRPR